MVASYMNIYGNMNESEWVYLHFFRHFYKGLKLLWFPVIFPRGGSAFKIGHALEEMIGSLRSKIFPFRVDAEFALLPGLFGVHSVRNNDNNNNNYNYYHHYYYYKSVNK